MLHLISVIILLEDHLHNNSHGLQRGPKFFFIGISFRERVSVVAVIMSNMIF